MKCPDCGYEMNDLDKECLRCKAGADNSARNPYVAHQNAQRKPPLDASTPSQIGPSLSMPPPNYAPPPTPVSPPGSPNPVFSMAQLGTSIAIALVAAVLAVILYNQFFVKPRIAVLTNRVFKLAANADHNAVILDKHTVAIRDLTDTASQNAQETDALRSSVNANAAANDSLQETVNYNANAANMNNSHY